MRYLALTLLLALTGCAPVGTSLYSGKSKQIQSRTYQDSFERVYEVAAQVATEMGWLITNTDQSVGRINARTPALSDRLADEVDLRVFPSSGGVQLRVKSGRGDALNRQHVATYLDRVSFALGAV